ncbi:LysE family translocator [Thalassobacillus hwangdonensis]|uniref:LysE family translocator n=1 Tax=Thalassobacillus hwangdonensis TaxID=546108 RepID=A0ABW3L1F9_9BACI
MGIVVGYILLGLSIAAPIGPINIEIINRGLKYGFWPSFCVGLGGMTFDFFFMAFMFMGLAQVLGIVWVKASLMLLGSVILITSGWTSLKGAPPETLHESEFPSRELKREALKGYLTGFTIAGTNPMNLLFWLGIYGSVLSTALTKGNPLESFLISSLVFVGLGLWNANLAFTIHYGRILMNGTITKLVHVTASFILIGFGIRFGYLSCIEWLNFFI